VPEERILDSATRTTSGKWRTSGPAGRIREIYVALGEGRAKKEEGKGVCAESLTSSAAPGGGEGSCSRLEPRVHASRSSKKDG